MRIKRIVIIVEICALLALAVLTAVLGFNKGVWDRSRFIPMKQDGSRKTYTVKAPSPAEIVTDETQSIVYFSSEDGGKVQLSYEAFGDSLKTVRFFSEDGVTVISDTYSVRERKWSSTYERDKTIGDYVYNNGSFKLGVSDKAILNMAIGNTQTRLSEHIKVFLIGLLLAVLGFAFNFITDVIVKLDKFLLGLFYDNSKNLRISEVGKDLLILPGIILFTVGVIFCTFVLLT